MPERNKDKTQDSVTAQVHSNHDGSQQRETPSGALSVSRRHFTRAGLLATPVLMSVVSRPVLGTTVHCLSNALSGNLSNPDRGLCSMGMPPSHWKSLITDCNNPATTPTFSSIPIFSTSGESRSFEEILCSDIDGNGDPTSDVAVFAVAYLNASTSGPGDYPLTVPQLGHLVNDTGAYTAFLSHYGGLRGYLESTW
ncbi:MAG: hypothetical protein KDI27_10235 [Gammaproteobacteria bacterium]|nr:hypothetical protein [Gammaproteobacteria bacterium]MCP5417677.1 hypothetical protein [Chromatiaceae bacterium]